MIPIARMRAACPVAAVTARSSRPSNATTGHLSTIASTVAALQAASSLSTAATAENRPEQCDDGINDASYGGCTPQCKLAPHCGDGLLNGPEECDDNDRNGLDGICTSWCKKLVYVPL
jgi:cysteine-rich repeat protein